MSADKAKNSNGKGVLENLISYSGESDGSDIRFDLALFKQLNDEFQSSPVVPKPREHSVVYTSGIGVKRGKMLERKIGIDNRRILEIGCGDGMLSRVLAKEHGCEVVGVDIQHYDSWAAPADGSLTHMVHDVTAGDNSVLGKFDRIVSFAVFEHIVHPHAALQAAYDLLKPGGKAYIYANLYRGAKASHRYREVFFPWPHLLFEASVWREFYLEKQGEPLQAAWVNKLTYDQYIGMATRIGFDIKEHFPSAPYFNEAFYERFEYQLAAYPKFDLKHDFIHLVLEKPAVQSASPNDRGINAKQKALLEYPPQTNPAAADYDRAFWQRVSAEVPAWSHYEARWQQSRQPGANAIDDSLPWVTFPAIDFLTENLPPQCKIFEWGSGGSTLFFKQYASDVISIEHDRGWFQRVADILATEKDSKTTYELVEPAANKPANWRHASGSRNCEALDFKSYVEAIQPYDDASFALVAVDGRARMGCLEAAVSKVAPGGYLLLDNANYPRYRERLEDIRSRLLGKWQEFNLAGPGPYSRTPCWETVIWQRPEKPLPVLSSRSARKQESAPPAKSTTTIDWSKLEGFRAMVASQKLRPYDRISYAKWKSADVEAVRPGKPFQVLGFDFTLDEDYDWNDHRDLRSKRLLMHSWHQIEPLLIAYDEDRDLEKLLLSCRIMHSWVKTFSGKEQLGGPLFAAVSESDEEHMLSSGTAVSNRFYRLAYVVSAIATLDSVDHMVFNTLFESLVLHADLLERDEDFSADNNHGFLQALAQVSGATRFSGLDQSWKQGAAISGLERACEQGKQRLQTLLQNQVTADGIHKEHSFAYHVVVTSALKWCLDNNVLEDPAVASIVAKMQDASVWMHDCHGRVANIGDSDLYSDLLETEQAYVGEPEARQIVFKDGGYWFVKAAGELGTTYLAQSCAFHSRFHKQADSGCLVWHDRGHPILIDAGRFGYAGRTERGSALFKDGFWYSDPKRIHVESTRAHNTLEIDGRNHRRYRQPPLGGTISGTVEADGVVASRCSVPNAGPGYHQRFVVLRPGEWLVVIDSCRFPREGHTLRQWFNIHPDWMASHEDDHVVLTREDQTMTMQALLGDARIESVQRGVRIQTDDPVDPGYRGWWSPNAGVFEPSTSISVRSEGGFVSAATLFSLGGAMPVTTVAAVNTTHRNYRFNFESGGVRSELRVASGGFRDADFTVSYNSKD